MKHKIKTQIKNLWCENLVFSSMMLFIICVFFCLLVRLISFSMSTKEVHTRRLRRVCERTYIYILTSNVSVCNIKIQLVLTKHKTLNHTPWTESRSLCRERQRRDVCWNLSCFIASNFVNFQPYRERSLVRSKSINSHKLTMIFGEI